MLPICVNKQLKKYLHKYIYSRLVCDISTALFV